MKARQCRRLFFLATLKENELWKCLGIYVLVFNNTLDTTIYCVSAPSVNQVFSADFEINPLHVEADMSLRLTVQPVEIVYDEVNIKLRLSSISTYGLLEKELRSQF